jgi:AcrR family transcriptional regulator
MAKLNGAGKGQTKRVLLAALELFSKHGYDDTSMHKVAAKAGIDIKTVNRLFPEKADLLGCILDFYKEAAYEFTPPPENLARLTKDATTEDVIACLYLYFPEGEESYYMQAVSILYQEQYRNNDVREFFTSNYITWQESYIAEILQRLVDVRALCEHVNIDFWSRLHVNNTYAFAGRHVMGLSDRHRNFSGMNMEEMIRMAFDIIFTLYGKKAPAFRCPVCGVKPVICMFGNI